MNRKLLSFLLATSLVIGIAVLALSSFEPSFLSTSAPIPLPKTDQEIADCRKKFNDRITSILSNSTSAPATYRDAYRVAVGNANRARTQYISGNRLPTDSERWTYVQRQAVGYTFASTLREKFISELGRTDRALLRQYEPNLQDAYDEYQKCIAPGQIIIPPGSTGIPQNTPVPIPLGGGAIPQ